MRTTTEWHMIFLCVLGITIFLASPALGTFISTFECNYDEHECTRKPLETSGNGYCIFHAGPEEKDAREFIEALENYILETRITQQLKHYDFNGFVFVGRTYAYDDLGFPGNPINVFGPLENVSFMDAEFHSDVNFENEVFKGSTNFAYAEFHGDAQFLNAKFSGSANFSHAKFNGSAGFLNTKFSQTANFERVGFYGDTYFLGSEFYGDANFNRAVFEGHSWISPEFINGGASFRFAALGGVRLSPLGLDENAWVDFYNVAFANTEIRREDVEGHIIQEHKRDFLGAKGIYSALRNNFRSLGRYDDQVWAFKKEKDMERKVYFYAGRPVKWFSSLLLNGLYGYGVEPLKVVLSAVIMVFFFAFLFLIFGISVKECLEPSTVREGRGKTPRSDLFTRVRTVPWRRFWSCLYFSSITFTTLTFGDYRPSSKTSRVLAGIEAFAGLFMMGLFVYTFARRTAGG